MIDDIVDLIRGSGAEVEAKIRGSGGEVEIGGNREGAEKETQLVFFQHRNDNFLALIFLKIGGNRKKNRDDLCKNF